MQFLHYQRRLAIKSVCHTLHDKKYTITLGDFDLGQMLHGIRECAKEYRNTERYHEKETAVHWDQFLK
jgi:hypothetical protein